MTPDTKTLSIPACPQCRKPHHLPLIFIEVDTETWQATCTNTLRPVTARMDGDGRLTV